MIGHFDVNIAMLCFSLTIFQLITIRPVSRDAQTILTALKRPNLKSLPEIFFSRVWLATTDNYILLFIFVWF